MTDHGERQSWEDRLAAPMFLLSVLFLIVLAGLIHRYPREETPAWEIQLISGLLGLLWLAFLPDASYRFATARAQAGFGPAWRQALAFCLAPPLRMGARGILRPDQIWLPRRGWQTVDPDLYRRLERLFSVPMILIALMILPLLAIEYVWYDETRSQPVLALCLDIGVSIIWLAFAIELILMVSVAKNKLEYCVRHWVDLAIVLLPILEVLVRLLESIVNALPMLRLLRLSRILRLDMLTRFGRLYRLRGLAFKAWRAFLVLEIIQRVSGQTLERRLHKLEELLHAKEDEVAELRGEVEQLKEQIAQQQQVEPLAAEGPPVPVLVELPAPTGEGDKPCGSGI